MHTGGEYWHWEDSWLGEEHTIIRGGGVRCNGGADGGQGGDGALGTSPAAKVDQINRNNNQLI